MNSPHFSTFDPQFPALHPYSILPIPREETLATSSWFGFFVLLMLIALAFSVSAHRKQYSLHVRNLLNKQGRVMNYDQEATSVWANMLLWYAVVSSYVLLLLTDTFLYPILFVVVASYFGLKWVFFRFVGYVFGLKDVARSFSTDYFVIVAIFGLLLFPICCCRVYMLDVPNLVWYILLSIMGLLVLITLFIKLLQIFYTGISSLFYIFLYLCTSEILPLLVAAKVALIVGSSV